MDILSNLLIPIVNLDLLMLIAVGTFAGIYVGAIPGLSVTMAVSILISFTFSWEVYPALALMIGIYMGGVYGGSRTAILLNIPGAPSAIATALKTAIPRQLETATSFAHEPSGKLRFRSAQSTTRRAASLKRSSPCTWAR